MATKQWPVPLDEGWPSDSEGAFGGVAQAVSTWGTRIRQTRKDGAQGVRLPEHAIRVPHFLKSMGRPAHGTADR